MPLSKSEFDGRLPTSPDWLSGAPAAQRVFAYLREHDRTAYTTKEIAERTDVQRAIVADALPRLHERGLVRYCNGCWLIAPDDRIAVDDAIRDTSAASVTDDYFAEAGVDPEDLEHIPR